MAYHAGALRALESEAGFVPATADLIVGTSAGSVLAAYLRSGSWTTEDFWLLAMGVHPEMPPIGEDPDQPNVMTPTFSGPVDAVRRGLGSFYVMGRSVMRLPMPALPSALQRAFPGGLFSMEEGRRRFEEELPSKWPSDPTWICAVDISTGRRIVLGRPGAPTVSLPDAVSASCAIPGFFKPVRVGDMTLVDGGAHSTTNLDLAAKAGCDVIIGVVPMAWDTASPPDPMSQLMRRIPARQLMGEVAYARRKGSEVLLLRPTADEIRIQGFNMMRMDGLETVALAAYDAASRTLATDRFRSALEGLAA